MHIVRVEFVSSFSAVADVEYLLVVCDEDYREHLYFSLLHTEKLITPERYLNRDGNLLMMNSSVPKAWGKHITSTDFFYNP